MTESELLPVQTRYYAVEDRPVVLEVIGPSQQIARALDLNTGAFVLDDMMLSRIASNDPTVEELPEQAFQRLVQELRRSASYDRQLTPMDWHSTGDPEYPYKSMLDGTTYTLYVGDFPAEPMYSLLIDGQTVDSLDTWPHTWIRD